MVVGIVGTAASAASAAALSWAVAEACAHRAPLVVVYVLDPRGHKAVYSRAAAHDDADGVLSRFVGLVDQDFPGPIEQIFEIGVPSRVLVHSARGARMLVLGHGSHHHRDASDEQYPPGPALGPVARACVIHAECPVVVVPEPSARTVETEATAPSRHAPLVGGRAIFPYQGRIPVAHH